jgi:DNA-binding transcriptional LysR family regulator
MIRHLPYFAVVAEEQHFQRAADRLRITQSALSRRIQLLEEELEVKLFERLARGVRLTPAGESFYNDVRRFQVDLEQAKARARNIMQGRQGRVDVGLAPSAVSNPVVAGMFRVLRKAHPEIQINIQLIYSEEQLTALQAQSIDIGVLYLLSPSKGLSHRSIGPDRLVLAMPADHPLAHKRQLRMADLAETPFIWPTRSHSPRLYDRLIAACQARGLTPKIEIEVHSAESVLSIVAMGLAVGFLSQTLAGQAPPGVVVRDVPDFGVELPLCLAWRANDGSPILRHFGEALDAAIARDRAAEPTAGRSEGFR